MNIGRAAKWMSQSCRMAHRAGVPWTLTIKASKPWQVPGLRGLRKLRYVCEKRGEAKGKATVLLTSEIVDIDSMSRAGFPKQLQDPLNTTRAELAAIELGRTAEAYDDGDAAGWRKKAQEDAAAIGGLRNPMSSILRLPGAKQTGAKLREEIDR